MPAAMSSAVTAARDRGIHAIQIEIDRSTYLDRELRSPGPGFAGICQLIATVVEALESRLLGSDGHCRRVSLPRRPYVRLRHPQRK